MSSLFSNLFSPLKAHTRNVGKKVELLLPRGRSPRNEVVPIQIRENLMEVRTEIEKDNRHSVQTLKHLDYFDVHNIFTVADMFKARVHYGHREGSLEDGMKPYIYGNRLSHMIFDLDKSAEHLRRALNFVAHISYRDGIILFISKDPQFTYLVEETAKECNQFAQARKWVRGTFTNANVYDITRLPDVCVFINTLDDVLQQHVAISEAAKMLIPTVGIVDSNCNPNLITYPVPGNDDSIASAEFYCKVFKEAVQRGANKRKLDSETRKSPSTTKSQSAPSKVGKLEERL